MASGIRGLEGLQVLQCRRVVDRPINKEQSRAAIGHALGLQVFEARRGSFNVELTSSQASLKAGSQDGRRYSEKRRNRYDVWRCHRSQPFKLREHSLYSGNDSPFFYEPSNRSSPVSGEALVLLNNPTAFTCPWFATKVRRWAAVRVAGRGNATRFRIWCDWILGSRVIHSETQYQIGTSRTFMPSRIRLGDDAGSRAFGKRGAVTGAALAQRRVAAMTRRHTDPPDGRPRRTPPTRPCDKDNGGRIATRDYLAWRPHRSQAGASHHFRLQGGGLASHDGPPRRAAASVQAAGLVAQLGGAAETLASLGDAALDVQKEFARELGLVAAAAISLQSTREVQAEDWHGPRSWPSPLRS